MAHPKIEVVDDRTLRVEGLGECFIDDWIMGSEDVLGPASATSLRHAVTRLDHQYGDGSETPIYLTIEQPHHGNRDLIQPASVAMGVSKDRMTVTAVDYLHDQYPVNMAELMPKYKSLLDPLLVRHRGRIEELWSTETSDGSAVIGVVVSLSTRGRSVSEIADTGAEFDFLVSAASVSSAQSFGASGALELLKFGQGHLLSGLPESDWLDAKEMPYLRTPEGKYELAKDVAAFANTGQDALIAIGFKNSRTGDLDVVSTPRPFPPQLMSRESIRGQLSNTVIPRVEGLEIGTALVPGDQKALGWIFVPAQRSDLMPFLVRGARVRGKIKENFFSLPHRDGEHTNFSDPEAVQAFIAAGQRALRG